METPEQIEQVRIDRARAAVTTQSIIDDLKADNATWNEIAIWEERLEKLMQPYNG